MIGFLRIHGSEIVLYLLCFVCVNHVSKDESANLFDQTMPEKPYRPPFARASSLEDSSTGISQNADVPPVLNTGRTVTGAQTIKANAHHVLDMSQVDQMDESHEKTRSKESKGLKKLWKFGRKGHSSGSSDSNQDSNGSAVDDHLTSSSSSDSKSLFSPLVITS